MHSNWFIFFLICEAFHHQVHALRKIVHSGRIPSNVKIYPKSELTRPYSRLIPSNGEDNELLTTGPSSSKLKLSDESVASKIKLPSPLNDLIHEHKILYLRALQKDFDYAQFGEPCQVFTVDELEAFLRIMEESIEPQEGMLQLPRISPQEKGEQLERIFSYSRVICDFRNLLTCHRHFLTCACAHPSMGVNREGLCGIGIGHPCEMSERTLMRHGIPMIPEMSPVKCLLENAECVMDSESDLLGAGFSTSRKVCKCRRGFWGATCSRRYDQAGTKLVSSRDQRPVYDALQASIRTEDLSEEVEVGRPLWMNDISVGSSEYFMHPEEIRDKLVESMNEKEMYPAETRMLEAEKLMRNMEADVDKEEMVINELRLRQLAHLNHGDACDPERQVILDNPPLATDAASRWIDPYPHDIKSWQLSLLQPNKPFCNVHKLLRCNEATNVCECKPGLELDSIERRHSISPCKIPLGYNCNEDFIPILEFDPLKDRKRFSEMDPPNCMPGTECSDKPLFFQKKCWCSSQTGNCDKGAFNEGLYSSMVKTLRSRLTLRLGDSCDPKLHQRFFTYGRDEDPDYKKRLQFLQEIIENPESRLCDIHSYLNCSDVSRTCECWKQLQSTEREDGEADCVAMNMASCGRTFKFGKYMYSQDDAQLWQVEKTLQGRFLPGCVSGALCTGGNNPEWAGRCLCENSNKTGEACEDRKSILASAFRASHIPQNDDEEVAILHVYFDLNTQTLLMEQLMTSGVNDVCDPDIGLTLDRIMKFWREIANSSDMDTERRTLPYYIAATKWTKYLVNTVQGNSASLCNATVGLRCQRTTGRCGCARGARWIQSKCHLQVDEKCDPKPTTGWVSTCAPGSKCMAVEKMYFEGHSCKSCLRKNPNGSCVVSQHEDEYEEEDIWDTWNVEDDGGKDKKKRMVDKEVELDLPTESAKEPSKVNLAPEQIVLDLPDERVSSNQIDKAQEGEEVKKFFLIRRTNRPAKVSSRTDKSEMGNHFVTQSPNKGTSGRENYRTETPPTSTKKPRRQAPNAVTDTNDLKMHLPDIYIQEINRMLKEIIAYRKISFGGACTIQDEEELTEVFPTLLVYDLERLPFSIPMAYTILSRLYWKGISFCDRNLFLKCTNEEVCGCSFGFGLIEEEGECRLKEHIYCDRDTINAGKQNIDFVQQEKNRRSDYPIFQCQTGTTCTQIDHGLPVCLNDDNLDGKNERSSVFERQLSMSNDDFNSHSRTRSWTEVEIFSVGMAVGVRLVILRFFCI